MKKNTLKKRVIALAAIILFRILIYFLHIVFEYSLTMDIIYLITRISVFSAVGLIIYYMIKTVNNEQSEEAKDKTDLKTPIKIIVFPALAYYLSSVV